MNCVVLAAVVVVIQFTGCGFAVRSWRLLSGNVCNLGHHRHNGVGASAIHAILVVMLACAFVPRPCSPFPGICAILLSSRVFPVPCLAGSPLDVTCNSGHDHRLRFCVGLASFASLRRSWWHVVLCGGSSDLSAAICVLYACAGVECNDHCFFGVHVMCECRRLQCLWGNMRFLAASSWC